MGMFLLQYPAWWAHGYHRDPVRAHFHHPVRVKTTSENLEEKNHGKIQQAVALGYSVLEIS
jgi:hypothetical protein